MKAHEKKAHTGHMARVRAVHRRWHLDLMMLLDLSEGDQLSEWALALCKRSPRVYSGL